MSTVESNIHDTDWFLSVCSCNTYDTYNKRGGKVISIIVSLLYFTKSGKIF